MKPIPFAAACCVCVAVACAQPFPPPPISPPAGHPRLLLRASELPEMKRRMGDPIFAKAWKRILDQSTNAFDGKLAEGPTNYDGRIHDTAESCALRYLLEGDEAMGRKAVGIVRNALPVVTYPEKQDITREKGATIFTAALVYDWCFPLLSKEDKGLVIANMKRIAKLTEIGYPPWRQGAITGHAGEAQLMRDQLGGGIAVYDEDPEMYTVSASRFFAQFVEARDFFYPSAWHHQGSSYGPYRYAWEIFASWIFKRMSGTNVFCADQSQIPYAWVYGRRSDGQLMADGDGPNMKIKESGPPFPIAADLLTAAYYRDPVLMGVAAKRIAAKDRVTYLQTYFLFHDPTIKAAPVETLPLSRWFGEPAGILIARTGWEEGTNAASVVAQMKLAPWMFNNHQHLDAGHFQLWYKGILASDSGFYQGPEGGYGCDHDINYHKRSIAHNTVLVRDPDEVPTWGRKNGGKPVANDGGQNWPLSGDEPVVLGDLKTNGYHVGAILSHAMGPDMKDPLFSHSSGELAGAYGKKVERFIRSFVFLSLKDSAHPAALVVYDRIRSAMASFKKTWLLHAPEKPEGDATAFATKGAWGGRMDARVLLPKPGAGQMELIGGPGKEFWVDGKNYPQGPKSGKLADYENACWRVELSPKEDNQEARFLVVMQVRDDVQGSAPLEVKSMEGADWTGVRVGGRVVVFPTGYSSLEKIKLEVEGTPCHCVLTGLKSGTWTLSLAGKSSEMTVTKEAGLLEFSAKPGTVSGAWVR